MRLGVGDIEGIPKLSACAEDSSVSRIQSLRGITFSIVDTENQIVIKAAGIASQ
jgi:hypothetical protein